MLIIDKRKYERIVSDLIDARDIRDIVDKFSIDRIYYYHILKDISSGQRSPNFKYLESIARKRKLSEDFIVEQSKSVLNFFIPYYQSYQSDSLDYYKLLNVNRSATEEEIRRSWIELMKSHHPDKAGAEGLDVAKKINEAYEILSNSAKRESYDNKHLPAMPVIIPENAMTKYYYAVPIALAVFLVMMYASGSGLIFKSPEEKEQFARVIEDPSLPNAVYKGDLMKDKPGDKDISRIKPIEPRSDTNSVIPENENEPVETPSNRAKNAAENPAGEKAAAANDNAGKNKEIGSAEPQEKESPAQIAKNPETKELAAAKNLDTKPSAEEPEKKTETAQPSPGEAEKAVSTGGKSAVSEKVTAESQSAGKKGAAADKAASEEKSSMRAKETESVDNALIVEKPHETARPVSEVASIPAIPKSETPAGATYHTVKKGESLWSIAHRYDTTTAEISKLNNIENGKVNIGVKLLISGNGVPLHEADISRVVAVNKVPPPRTCTGSGAKETGDCEDREYKSGAYRKVPAEIRYYCRFQSGSCHVCCLDKEYGGRCAATGPACPPSRRAVPLLVRYKLCVCLQEQGYRSRESPVCAGCQRKRR